MAKKKESKAKASKKLTKQAVARGIIIKKDATHRKKRNIGRH